MGDKSESLLQKRKQHIPQGVGNLTPLFIARAEGALLEDVDGKKYIDFAGGIGVNNVGHRNPAVVEAVKNQADMFLHPCFHVMMYDSYINLAEKLNQIIPCRPPRKTMFANSGAEAVENAVKIARYHTGRLGVVCFDNAFHGRTLLCMSLTSKVKPYKYRLGAMVPGIYRASFPYCYRCPWGKTYPECQVPCGEKYFEEDFFKHRVAPDEVAAIIMEPVQGEGGFIAPPPEYLGQMRRLCDKYGIVLIADEVQTGFTRTGKMFALEHYKVEADIVTTAKSLAGGLPLSAITGTAQIMDSVHVGGLGGTYGGNPLACRAALAVLDIIEKENLAAKSAQLGKRLKARLEELKARYPLIGQVRGLGSMLAMELVKDPQTKEPAAEETKALTTYCYQNGLIILDCGTLGNNIRILMPVTITDEQIDKGLAILEAGLKHISS